MVLVLSTFETEKIISVPGIYIHIPFCRQACHYCDFHFSTNLALQNDMVEAIKQEIILQKNYLSDKKLDSVYFGGGTPTLLNHNQIEGILNAIKDIFTLSSPSEITIEANPDDLSRTKLIQIKELGINRLSVGIQSFNDQILKYINRVHNSAMAQEAIKNAREVGFNNISLDLMYAIPGQDDNMWLSSIEQALSFDPEHISSYSLTIEEKTAFGNWNKKNKLTPVDDAINAHQYETLMEKLASAGYDHYEISNFSKPGFESRHNSSYWKQQAYLGIGPGAHSYNKESRQFNVSNNALYIKSLQRGEVPFKEEILTRENKINEYIFTTLRTHWGCNLKVLESTFGYDLLKERGKQIESLNKENLITIQKSILTLTRSGKLLADQICIDLMV